MNQRAWRERFEAFADSRMQAALSASMPPYRTEYEQPEPNMLAIGSAWTRTQFDGPFYLSPRRVVSRPSCSLVVEQSADLNTGASNPADLGGGATDTHLIYEGLSRVAADAVLAGAGTVRGGDLLFSVWHPELVALRASLGLPRHPVQMVATVQGIDVERILLFNVPEIRAIVLTVADSAARLRTALANRPWVSMVVMADRDDMRRAFEQLPGLGVSRISCIGGRHLAGSLLDADVIDDVYLTTAPRPGGEPNTPLPAGATSGRVVLRKRGTREETGVVFEQFTLSGSG
jgi:5-amino-6-(5-phosphoribosylamino)uracil reductase